MHDKYGQFECDKCGTQDAKDGYCCGCGLPED